MALIDGKPIGALDMAGRFGAGTLSPVEVVTDALKRIHAANEAVNAFSHIDEEGALESARASEQRWHEKAPLSPIDGVPTTIKDIVECKDWATTFGSNVFDKKAPSAADAPCVVRLKEAGACLLGLTTTPEIGWKGVTDSSRFGITRNPWDTTKTPGGSSGGAAAAAVLDMGALHIGTDGGGSIRIPAGFSGCFGHKPSFGRVPAYPISAFGTVAHIGPMTRSVADAAAMLSVLSKPDPRDWYALPYSGEDYTVDLERGIEGLRIAYSPTLGHVDVDGEVAEAVEQAVKVFETLDARIEQVDPGFSSPQEIFHTLWFAGAAHRAAHLTQEERAQLDPGLQEIIQEGEAVDMNAFFTATQARAELGSLMKQFHQTYDLLLTPTLPIPAFEAGLECLPHQSRWTDWAGFSFPFNLTQQPAASIPCGLTNAGLPIGLQIVGPMFADGLVLRAARAFEKTQDWKFPTN